MLKIIPPDSYDFGESPLRLVKMRRSGLGHNDRLDLLKIASEGFVAKLAQHELKPGDVLAHNIALSATERTGPNRNADGFRLEECRRCHPTFVKHSRAFRDHNNKNVHKSYGLVPLSHFNEKMGRIELGILYNGDKRAAARNGGLVADLEVEKLAKDEAFPTSMACYVRHDVCSGCGNKARHRGEYCGPEKCAKYGGLRDNLGMTFADGHMLHADNPDPRWFDISHIVGGRGADRTSFTLGRVKAAADRVKSGAELAEDWGLTTPIFPDAVAGLSGGFMKVAAELADAPDALAAPWARAFSPAVQPGLESVPDIGPRGEKLARYLKALADARVVLPAREFLAVTLRDPKQAAEIAPLVTPLVPDAYRAILADPDSLIENPYLPAATATESARAWAAKVAADYGIDRASVRRRLALAALRGPADRNDVIPIRAKTASSPAAGELARQYALYKSAALAAMAECPDRDWFLVAAAAQDRST